MRAFCFREQYWGLIHTPMKSNSRLVSDSHYLFATLPVFFFFLLLSVWKMSFNAMSQFEMNPQSWDRNLMFRFRNKMSNWQRHCSPNVLTFDWWAFLQTCQTRQVSNFSSSISLTPPPQVTFSLSWRRQFVRCWRHRQWPSRGEIRHNFVDRARHRYGVLWLGLYL